MVMGAAASVATPSFAFESEECKVKIPQEPFYLFRPKPESKKGQTDFKELGSKLCRNMIRCQTNAVVPASIREKYEKIMNAEDKDANEKTEPVEQTTEYFEKLVPIEEKNDPLGKDFYIRANEKLKIMHK